MVLLSCNYVNVLFLFSVLVLALVVVDGTSVGGSVVSYDGRSLIINGTRRILFSGSIHYPRSTPQMWPHLISKAKKGGLDVIQTYVFWNLHEPAPGQYNFEGNADLVRFIKVIQAQGLLVSLRIGPFIESEWNYGGFPFWLHDVPGIIFRTDNEPFKYYMQNWTTKVVDMMKSHNLFASQGGPIILSQIENEYAMVEPAFREAGISYVKWAASMAVGLGTGVPWVMCKQDDAPDPVINACNGLNCAETFHGPNSPTKPAVWTENWTQQYEVFGGDPKKRSVEDIAYSVALWVAKNGSFINYYMYHGGTNFGRTASSFVTTSYYDQAPIDEYGMLTEPCWGHLKELHTAVKLVSMPLLNGTANVRELGTFQEAYVFEKQGGDCVAFLANRDNQSASLLEFRGQSYHLPSRSVSILANCETLIYNTAMVSSQHKIRSYAAVNDTDITYWEAFIEAVPKYEATPLRADHLLEQMTTTKDRSDYLWYTTSFDSHDEYQKATLHVESSAHIVHVFVNNIYAGTEHSGYNLPNVLFKHPITLKKGINQISMLSAMVGLLDKGAYLEHREAGIQVVRIEGNSNISKHPWGYQVGLLGEELKIFEREGSEKVNWTSLGAASMQTPITWYKTTLDSPKGNDPVALNLSSMGKGQAWINGKSIGRYWTSFVSKTGDPIQSLYHVPRSFLEPSAKNIVVLFEEIGGNPLHVSFTTVQASQIFGHVHEFYPAPVDITTMKWNQHENITAYPAQLRLICRQGRRISNIDFASFGTPIGDYWYHQGGSCEAKTPQKILEEACLGRRACHVEVSTKAFGIDPCPNTTKSLMVVASCR